MDLSERVLLGADISDARLPGADLSNTQLRGSSLFSAQLEGADVSGAQLQGANLSSARLQDADLSNSHLTLTLEHVAIETNYIRNDECVGAFLGGEEFNRRPPALISTSFLWRARTSNCGYARTTNPNFEHTITALRPPRPGEGEMSVSFQVDPKDIERYIEGFVREIPHVPNAEPKVEVRERLRKALGTDDKTDDTSALASVWRECVAIAATTPQSDYDEQHVTFLLDLVCSAPNHQKEITEGLFRGWISEPWRPRRAQAIISVFVSPAHSSIEKTVLALGTLMSLKRRARRASRARLRWNNPKFPAGDLNEPSAVTPPQRSTV